MKHRIESIAKQFCISGELIEVKPLPRGHINDTYILTTKKNKHTVRYILQRINHTIFKDPSSLMENITRVTGHIRARTQETDPGRASRQLTVIQCNDGNGFYRDRDAEGNFWRAYNFIEGAVTYDTVESPEPAYEAARMFGLFQNMLIDLPGPALHETICDFHNTPRRFETFRQVLEEDTCNRAKDAKGEIDFLFDNAAICSALLNLAGEGKIPVRVAHNDAKINNVMLDKTTNKGVCVIDLDTVMPGLSIYDFGDLVRTAATSADEDERDLSKVAVDFSTFKALVRGYSEHAKSFLTPVEKKHLVFAAKLITFEQFIRFLTDHLAGDVYYKVHRAGHNLDRSRTQRKLVRSIMEHEEAMNKVVQQVFEQAD